MFWTIAFSFDEDTLAFFFWFGDCFGYYFQILGEFFRNLLVILLSNELRRAIKVAKKMSFQEFL
jgi:hypothetical protein